MLFCNPNSGYYESLYYQSDWIDYYTAHGIDIVLWNYRGYGSVKGRPSPDRIVHDGQIIIAYLRREKKGKIGVHGESIGGAIAARLAHTCELDFLFSDRSFSSILDVAYHNIGCFGSLGLRLTTKWTHDYS